MKIDSHHHIWDLSVRDQDWIVGESLAPIRRNFLMSDYKETVKPFGIEKSVIVQTVTSYDETPELLAIAETDEMVAGDRKSTRLNSSHMSESRMPSSA